MLRLLVLLLCMLSVLQGPPLVLAKPDFGLSVPIAGSGMVSLAATDAYAVMEALDDNTGYTATADYPPLQDLADLLASVAEMTVALGGELVPLVTSLVSDVSGDVAGAFEPVFGKITDIKTTIGSELPPINAAIDALVGHYVPDQLIDGFERIVAGLDDVDAALGALKAAIDAAVAQAGSASDVTEALVRKLVQPALVYRAVYTINQLKAYMPVVKYTIDSTLENINLADDYLLIVAEALELASTDTGEMAGSIATVLGEIAITVQAELDALASAFTTLQDDVATLAQVPLASEFATLATALDGYGTLFATLSTTLYPAMDGHLQALVDGMAAALGGSATPNALPSDLLDSLILTLIESGKYAQFCFYKYYGLVLAALTKQSDSAGLCFDKEQHRLTTLKDMLPNLTALLSFDHENIFAQLGVCDSLANPSSVGECIFTLSGFYSTIATEFGHKLQMVFDLIQTETEASALRFQICVTLVQFNALAISDPQLGDEIRQCALGGPTADD